MGPLPPKRKKYAQLRDILQNKYDIQPRYSPIGVEEYVIPPEIESKIRPFDVLRGHAAAERVRTPDDPYILYKKQYSDAEKIKSHERIHAGQVLTGNNPDINTLLSVIPNFESIYPTNVQMSHLELPAYAFSGQSMLQNEQDKLAKYLNLTNYLNRGANEPIELGIPSNSLYNYVRNPNLIPHASKKIKMKELLEKEYNK